MNTSTNTATSLRAVPVPTKVPVPTNISDAELLAATRSLVGRSNQLLGALLAHLAEVEARGIHRTRACSSLYTYCIYELRFSEDEAFRRVAAARLVRRFPVLWDAVASGELHLTGLLMLGPHLTAENIGEVLLRAKHRTKKEIARLVRQLDPLPEVPPRIEPLGPAPARGVTHAPTWEEFARSLCPVRNLSPGDRPRDWMENANDTHATAPLMTSDTTEALAAAGLMTSDTTDAAVVSGLILSDTKAAGASEVAAGRAPLIEGPDQPPPAEPLLSPQRYKVQFTAGEEYVKLVEEARALLSHSAPRATVDEIHLRAMRTLVADLKRRKHAVSARPRKPRDEARSAPPLLDTASERSAQVESAHPRRREHVPETEPCAKFDAESLRQRGHIPESEQDARVQADHPRQGGRHIPAPVRRAVFQRDQGRCTYTDSSGRRCAETHLLELHHLKAFARGGKHTEDNLTLRCHAHNALAAEEDFGRELIERARDAAEHEPWILQLRS